MRARSTAEREPPAINDGKLGKYPTAKRGVMDELCQLYPGFYRYTKVLENIAGAIRDGVIKVPK